MTTPHPYLQCSQAARRPLSSRASSATLFFARPQNDCKDGPSDPIDVSIAQGILRKEHPRIPRRRSSFSQSTQHQVHDHQVGVDDAHQVDDENRRERYSRQGFTSNTWTSSSGDVSEDSECEDRTPFVLEYNRLAKKYGVLAIVPDEFVAVNVDKVTISAKQGSWIMRKLLRRTSSVHVSRSTAEKHVRHNRSISDISLRMKLQKDNLKDKDLVELVRLCGASALYLPAEYAAGTLAVPTCFRATSQYLIQHAATSRGIFRIPGSHSTINALYNYYASQEDDGEVISDTVRCPTLPEHIKCNVHDVASAFKKFLSGLPGGILGKVWLFDAFVSIHSQLDAAAELMRTKQSKIRARLIALAIATIGSRYQRELICAVIGLLSMIGRAAEIAPREDEHGRPLPTSDLMGYGALGIVFGPLLIGSLIDGHDLCPTGVHGSLVFVQRSPPKSSKGKHKKAKSADESINLMQSADKIRIVNSITEMLVTHWRDVVRHMKNLNALRSTRRHQILGRGRTESTLRRSDVEAFSIRKPKNLDAGQNSLRQVDRSRSPTPSSRNDIMNCPPTQQEPISSAQEENLTIIRQRPRPRPMPSQILSTSKSISILTPTREESQDEDQADQNSSDVDSGETIGLRPSHSAQTFHTARSEPFQKVHHRATDEVELFIPSGTPESTFVQVEHKVTKSSAKPFRHQSTHSDKSSASGHVLLHGPKNFRESIANDKTTGLESGSSNAMLNQTLILQTERNLQNKLPGLPRLISSPRKTPENSPLKSQPSTAVPSGLVSGRLRAIAAVELSKETAPRHVSTLESDCRSDQRNRTLSKSSSRAFGSCARDPLGRVSQEEDLASLMSLAEVVLSHERASNERSPGNEEQLESTDMPSNDKHSVTRSPLLSPHGSSESHLEQDLPSKVASNKIADSKLMIEAISVTSGIAEKTPMTPHRSAFDAPDIDRSGSSSVKALAARINDVGRNRGNSASHIYTPEIRRPGGSPLQATILSPYTVNSSPVPRSHMRNRSGASVKSIRYPLPVKRHTVVSPVKLKGTTTPQFNKPILITDYRQDNVGPPKWPQLRPVTRDFQYQSESVRKRESSPSPFPIASNLHCSGDGNMSFTFSRKSSIGTILPGPGGPPVASFMDFSRPSTTCQDHLSSPMEALNPSPSRARVLRELSGVSFPGQRSINRGSSMLYSQIQDLQKQLIAKGKEADHLRRQLMTKDSLHDLGTISEQLRQANRDLGIWRSRAEIAETRLESLSFISRKDRNEECAGDWFVTQTSRGLGISRITGDSLSADLPRRSHHEEEINSDFSKNEEAIQCPSAKQAFKTGTDLGSSKS